MLESTDILQIMAAAIAANEFIEKRDQYATVEENLEKSVNTFYIVYDKMLKNGSDAKIKESLRIAGR